MGKDDLSGASEVHVVARVLRSLQRVGGASEGVPIGEAVGLLEGDPAVARLVGGAAQAAQQVVGEEGGLEASSASCALSPPELEVTYTRPR